MRETDRSGPDTGPGSGTRRRLLRSLAVGGLASFAGCSGFFDDSNGDPTTRTDEPDSSATPEAGVLTTPEPTGSPNGPVSGPSTESVSRSTPKPIGADVRDRVRQVGSKVRPAVVFFDTDGFPTEVAGVFLEPSLVVTAASAMNSTTPEIRTVDGETYEATLVDRTIPSDGGDDVAAFRIAGEGQTLPGGSARRLSPEDLVVHVGHHRSLGNWLVQFGRVRGRTGNGDRLVTSVPIPTPGSALVTLDGELVGTTVGRFGSDPPPTEVPPPTEPPTVYTHRRQWSEAHHEPLADVRARVTEWTDD